ALPEIPALDQARDGSGLTTQAQRPGARDATIATATLMPGSLQRMVERLGDHKCKRVRMVPKMTGAQARASPNQAICFGVSCLRSETTPKIVLSSTHGA